jgi:hypothetical protein
MRDGGQRALPQLGRWKLTAGTLRPAAVSIGRLDSIDNLEAYACEIVKGGIVELRRARRVGRVAPWDRHRSIVSV